MIENRQRAKSMTIFNRTDKTLVYTFDWERRAQTPEGKLIKLEKGETSPGYKPADDMLIYSPRQVVVKPGKSQKIRIMVRRPEGLEDGEYHSHILIKPEDLESKKLNTEQEKGMSGTMKVKSYMSIPVFVRQGKTDIDFELTNGAIIKKDGQDAVRFTIENNSTRSFYAKEALDCTLADGTHKEIVLDAARVYVESQNITKERGIRKGAPPLSSCSALVLNLSALNDFKYKRNKPIGTLILK